MKRTILILSVFISFSLLANKASAQIEGIVGMWKTIDDDTGDAKSYVKIFKATNGMYYGKVTKLLTEPQDKKCTACVGKKKNKKIVGMIVITKMKIKGKGLAGGKIMDPGNGKYYYCTINLDENNKDRLNVRGSLGSFGLLGRTQVWHRLK